MDNNHITSLIKSFELLGDILVSVAEDEKTDPEILAKLYIDGGYYFHDFLALNPSTPVKLLKRILEGSEAEGRIHVLSNPSIPLSTIRNQIKIEEDQYVLEFASMVLAKRLLKTRSCSSSELLTLYKKVTENKPYDEARVQETISFLLKNPKFPKAKLE